MTQQNNKFKYGIDIDGTVTDPSFFLQYVGSKFNTDVTYEQVTEYDIEKFLGVSREELEKFLDMQQKHMYEQSPAIPTAQKVLKKWEQYKEAELRFISARPNKYTEVTREWFERNNIPYDGLHLLGGHDKRRYVTESGIHLFLEDRYENAVEISEDCRIPVILMDTPYNRKPVPDKVYRAYSWKEAEYLAKSFYFKWKLKQQKGG
jgi:uncharacterized protein